VFGAVALGANALRLPGWAMEREEQMEGIAARARVLLGAAPDPDAAGDMRLGSAAPSHPA